MERKRNIHTELRSKYGQESLKIYRQWEKFECKMADFLNHRCFSLRCLSKGLIPTSVRLKSNIKTPKGKYIIKKAELALLNERIRAINNSIAMLKIVIDTCMSQLESILDKKTMEDCYIYIEYRREGRHQKTLERHLSKFHRMCHRNTGGHSNLWHGNHDENCHLNTNTCMNTAIDTGTNRNTITSDQRVNNNNNNSLSNNTSNNNNNNNWVRNYSKTPLTEAQQ